jgi:hypothetical protein
VSPARHDDEPWNRDGEIQEENPVAGKQTGTNQELAFLADHRILVVDVTPEGCTNVDSRGGEQQP